MNMSGIERPGSKTPRVPFFVHKALALAALMTTLAACAGAPSSQKGLGGKTAREAAEPGWAFTSMSWSLDGGVLRDTGSAKSHAVLLSAMDPSHAWVEAELTVGGSTGTGWKVAGVSLYQDIRNYWHLALVEAPESMGSGRFVELKLMRDGQWGAESAFEGLVPAKSEGADLRWENGRRYRLRIESDGRSVAGRVWDGQGRLAAEIEQGLPAEEARPSFPGADNCGFVVDILKFTHSDAPGTKTGSRDVSSAAVAGFHTVVADSGIHWLRAPDGGKTLSIGCEWVKYREIWCQALGYSPYHRNTEKLFGSEAAWARDVADKLLSWGFNTTGQSDKNEEITCQGLAYAPILRMGQGFCDIASIVQKTYWTGFPDVFDPRFKRYCRMAAENQCRPWREDPRLLGYYIDNELEWFGKDHRPWSLFTSAMKLGPGSHAKLAAVGLLRQRHGRIGGFNSTWGAGIKSWEALAETSLALAPGNKAAIDDAEAFAALCAEEYFRITTDAIRRADPNHLVLGSRFAWLAPEPAWAAAGRHCDIVSFNSYPRVDMFSGDIPGLRDSLENRHRLCARPFLISEWGFPALDAGLPSTKGAGMRVDDQAQRAYCAARFQEEALSLPFVVGTSWFMWADEPALGVTDSFPENSNYGLVDVRHRPYLRVASALASVHRKAGAIHAGLSRRSTADSLRRVLASRYGAGNGGPRPSVRMRRGRLVIDNGDVRLVLTPGKSAGLDSIFWHGIPVGGYHPLLWQRRQCDGWLRPDRITGFEIGNTAGNGLTLSFRAEKAPADTAWCGFSISFRITVPPAGSFFLAEVTGIASLDLRPWELAGYYHYIPSWLGGGTAGDIPLVPDVPDYWLERGGWYDQALGLHYGALDLGRGRWSFHPYLDSLGFQHPDIFMPTRCPMSYGEPFLVGDGPLVIFMGRDDTRKQPWTKAAFQAWHWLEQAKLEEQSP